MPAPAITLTANVQDFSGNQLGSVGNPCRMCIALAAFGPQLPRVPSNGSMIGRPGPKWIESTNGVFSVPIYGNDVIVPLNQTYYAISLLDANGNVVQAGAYQLTGSGTQDLSGLTPITFPGQGLPPFVFALFTGTPTFPVVTGLVNGSNHNFTFPSPASPTPNVLVYAGGIFQTPTTDYSLSYLGSSTWQITFITAPISGPVTIVQFAQIGTSNYVTVTFSATPVFNTGGWTGQICFDLTLTGNVTSSTTSGLITGQFAVFFIQQDGVGGRTFAWPSNFKNAPTVHSAPNSVTTALFALRSDGNLYLVNS